MSDGILDTVQTVNQWSKRKQETLQEILEINPNVVDEDEEEVVEEDEVDEEL